MLDQRIIGVAMAIGLVIDGVGLWIVRRQIVATQHDLWLVEQRHLPPIGQVLIRHDLRDLIAFGMILLSSLIIDGLFLAGALSGSVRLEGFGGITLLGILFLLPSGMALNLVLKNRDWQRLQKLAEDDLDRAPKG